MRNTRVSGKSILHVIAGTDRESELVTATTADAQKIVDHYEQNDKTVSDTFHKVVLSFLRSEKFEQILRTICTDTARDMTGVHIAARVPELEQRIRTAVEKGFDTAVEQVVRAELDAAVADVKRRIFK